MKFNRKEFWKQYRLEFGRADQETVDAIEFLLNSFEGEDTWKNIPTVAYAFATIKHETAHTYKPITEYGGVKYFDKYDVGALGRRLGNTPEKDGDGYKYRGRGYVQLTGKSNYSKYGIASKPTMALDPVMAFHIMTDGMHKGLYTGKKLSDYINDRKTDYVNARRIINGTDKAGMIAGYAKSFEKILKDSAATPTPSNSAEPSDQTTASNSVEPTEQPPINTQVAEQIINTGDTTNTPPPVEKEMEAPGKEGATGTATKTTVLGLTVPPALYAIFQGATDLIEKGYIDAKEIGSTLLDLLKANYKYVFIVIGLIILLLIVKKLVKQVTFWIQMITAAVPTWNTVKVVPSETVKETGKWWQMWK